MDIGTALVLPDSRARVIRGSVWREGKWWERVYCASCHKFAGLMPEGLPYGFINCDDCHHKHGASTLFHVTPGEQYFEQIRLEQLEAHGRILRLDELQAVVDADSSPLATLLKQGQQPRR